MEKKDKLQLIEFVLDDEEGNLIGDVSIVSLVTSPAVDLASQFFNKVKTPKQFFAKLEDEKMVISGPIMIPNTPILRFDEKTGGYYNCWFSVDTIYKASQVIAKNGGLMKTSIEHEASKTNDGYFFESWIVGENDKIYDNYSKEDVPTGSWCGSVKIDSVELWDELKRLKEENPEFGFSIESIFASKLNFATVDELVKIVDSVEEGVTEEGVTEEVVEDEKPARVTKKQLVRDMLEDITSSDTIPSEDKIKLIEKLLTNI